MFGPYCKQVELFSPIVRFFCKLHGYLLTEIKSKIYLYSANKKRQENIWFVLWKVSWKGHGKCL